MMSDRRSHLRLCFAFCVIIVFFACISGDADRNVLTLNVPANVNLLQSLQQMLPEFEAAHQMQVKLMPFSGQEKLYAMMAAGQPPDVFYTNNAVRDRLAAEGRLLELHEVSQNDPFVQRVRPEFVERGTSLDGGWYQFCDWTYTFAIYYNRALLEASGVPFPDSAWTWEQMLAATRRLTHDRDGDGRPEQYGIFIAGHFVAALERMNGADYPANALLFEMSPESQRALQAYLDLMYREKVMPELAFVQAQGMQLSQMLNAGKVAMAVEALPNLDFIHALTIDWALAPLPRMGGHPPRYFRSASGGLSISAACNRPQSAWELVKWLISESPYNSPNPVLRDSDFVNGWESRYPVLRSRNFRQVWELSERFDGGDIRDFVRYSPWSSSVILEQLNPQLDLLLAGKIQLAELLRHTDALNQRVLAELRRVIDNPNLKPAFRDGLLAELRRQNITLSAPDKVSGAK